MNDNNAKTGGLGFLSVLTLIFITLKLTKVITWPWMWVLSPIWFPIIIGLAIILIAWLCVTISEKVKK